MVRSNMLRDWLRTLRSGPCVRCAADSVERFCADCRSDFVRVIEPCRRCGLTCPGGSPHRNCPADTPAWAIDEVVAPFAYAPPLTRFLHALKYGRQRHLGAALGELLGDELVQRIAGCDAIVIVPLHPVRLRQRTFNQADEIAQPVARALGSRILTSGIRRCIDTPPQTALGKHRRLASPERAFSVERRLAGRTLAIVDDVITTGATMSSLARALKQAGARRVLGLAVMRSLGTNDDASRLQTRS